MTQKILIKTPEQIEGIRKSCQLAALTLDYLKDLVIPGISTNELNAKATDFIVQHGAIPACKGYRGYPKETCISINEVICHGIPNSRRLVEGDIVKIDVTTILDGYFGDTCRTFPVGKISEEAQNLIDATKFCLNAAIRQVKPGASFEDISSIITTYAEMKGYSVVYQFCGHGTGLQFHEAPQIDHFDPSVSRYSTTYTNRPKIEKMAEGMIFTVEPMLNAGDPQSTLLNDEWTAVTVDGSLSAQFEHTIVVTQDGYEILTASLHH